MKNAIVFTCACVFTLACGGAETESDAQPTGDTAIGTVSIVSPISGATLSGTTVDVQLSSTVTILAAGDMTAGSGHHHLYLDADLTEAGVPVPSIPGSIVHMGDASSTFVFEGLSPGVHRLIAVVADGVHMPLQPWVVDTVTFTVN
jgi:hypothetical protein